MSIALFLPLIHPTNFAPTVLYLLGIWVFFYSASKHPEAGLYYIVPLLPLQTLRFKLHDFPLGAQWIDLMLLGCMIGAWRQGQSIFPKTGLSRLVLILAVVTYISLWRGSFFLDGALPLWFSDPRVSDWKNYLVIPLLFYVTTACIRDKKQMKILLFCMCLTLLSLNRAFINTMSHRDMSAFSYDIRDAGAMGYAGVNGLAALEACISVFLMSMYSIHKEKWPRIGYLFMLGTCLVALMYTMSRGGYAALLLGTLFVGLLKNKKLLLVLIVFLFTWQTLVPPAVRERVFMTHDDNGQLDPSAGDRVKLWENAVGYIKANPVFGVGFDTYKFMHALGPYEDTHNYYIKVMLEQGIIGLSIFLAILFNLFSRGFRLYRTSSDHFARGLGFGLAAMVLACAVTNLFGDRWTYIEETGYMWVITGFVARCQMLAEVEHEREPDAADSALDGYEREITDPEVAQQAG